MLLIYRRSFFTARLRKERRLTSTAEDRRGGRTKLIVSGPLPRRTRVGWTITGGRGRGRRTRAAQIALHLGVCWKSQRASGRESVSYYFTRKEKAGGEGEWGPRKGGGEVGEGRRGIGGKEKGGGESRSDILPKLGKALTDLLLRTDTKEGKEAQKKGVLHKKRATVKNSGGGAQLQG